jgi:cytoskeletal protein CcmA (bactofilin family)
MNGARIGGSIRIKGEIQAQEPLTIDGTIVGSIHVEGHAVTLTESSKVEATIIADTIVASGKVSGAMSAAKRILVQQTAHVDGELSAPALSVQEGAVLHAKINVEGRRQALALAS